MRLTLDREETEGPTLSRLELQDLCEQLQATIGVSLELTNECLEIIDRQRVLLTKLHNSIFPLDYNPPL